MSNKRAPLLGAIRNILIILFITTIVVFAANITTTEETTTSDLMIIKHPEVSEMNQEILNEESPKISQEVFQMMKQSTEIVVPQPVETVATYKYNISSEDRETLARLIFLEANTESLECQKAITSIVINRMHSGYWGNSINSVIYASGQFTPASQIPYVTPTATNYEAVDYVLTNGVTLPSYCLYFRAGYHFSWQGYVPYIAIDNTYFGYMAKDK